MVGANLALLGTEKACLSYTKNGSDMGVSGAPCYWTILAFWLACTGLDLAPSHCPVIPPLVQASAFPMAAGLWEREGMSQERGLVTFSASALKLHTLHQVFL